MEPYKNAERLSKLAEDFTQDTTISQGMTDASLSIEEIRQALYNQEESIWATTTTEILELEKLEQRIRKFESSNIRYLTEPKLRYKNAYQLKLIPVFLSLLVAFLFFPILLELLSFLTGDNTTFSWEIARVRTWLTVFGSFSVAIFGYRIFLYLVYLVIKQLNVRFLQGISGPEGYSNYLSWIRQHVDLAKIADANLRDKGILELIRSLINDRIAPSYALSLTHIEGKGLAEVIDVSQTIDSNAKQRLDFLLNNMPGGSIGIAGPRGAGKSTLIHTFCGSKPLATQMKDKPLLATMVSAPVKYDSREFILYLFSAVCQSVLKKEDRLPEDLFEDEIQRTHGNIGSWRLWIWSYLPVIAIILSLVFFWTSWTLYSWHKEFHESIKKAKAFSQHTTVKDTLTLDRTHTKDSTKKQVKYPDTSQIKNSIDSTSSFIQFYSYQVSKSTQSPVTIFNISIFLMIIGIITLIFGKRDRNAFFTFFLVFIRIMLRADQVKQRSKKAYKTYLPPLSATALRWLKKLKFQQSYTAGWSGSLKLPIALDGSLSRAMTLAEKQLSNPEIIEAFTDMLSLCTADYQVIIGIDELDKMTSEEDAKLFLNEIKSVFGIPRVFYLISVSENAMNSFERRGMPFRDVFDSSFDSIVYVDYLSLHATQLLLQRRIIGKPIPFFALAFCLSGGLPRDVIRYFRQILELAVDDRQLGGIVLRLMTAEVDAKIRAVMHSLRKLRQVPGTDVVLTALYKMKPGNYTVTDLETAAGHLQKQVNKLIPVAETTDATEDSRQLVTLASEICSYLAYATTLMALFSFSTETEITQMETAGHYQELGRIRQLLAVDHALALDQVITLRKSAQLIPIVGVRLKALN